jgi:hypothetical protein
MFHARQRVTAICALSSSMVSAVNVRFPAIAEQARRVSFEYRRRPDLSRWVGGALSSSTHWTIATRFGPSSSTSSAAEKEGVHAEAGRRGRTPLNYSDETEDNRDARHNATARVMLATQWESAGR